MPPKRAFFRATRAGPMLARIGRGFGVVLITGFALFALALLAVRFIVFPQVESHRDAIAAALAAQLGRPIEIAVLATGWDGWNPKLVIEGFRILDREQAGAMPLVELPVVELVVSWTSLPLLDLRLKELVIERPRLAIRRDRAGMLRIAGIEFDPAQAPDDTSLADWILRQRLIVVRDALITWNDDLRNAPQLVLDRVQFRLHNRFGRHRFGLTGVPPTEIAAPIDVRGDVRGVAANDWQRAVGTLYVRLDYADVAAWREWLPLPVPIASGKGAMRLWLQFAADGAREIVADLELAEVRAQLGEALPWLELSHVAGRAGWSSGASGSEFFARGLAVATADGQRLGPTDMKLGLNNAAGNRGAGGRIEIDRLELAPLRELARHLPLPEGMRAALDRFAPRGTLAHASARWEGAADAPVAFAAAAEFAGAGVAAHESFPGVTGLSGRFEATQEKGELRIASRDVALALPRVLAEAIPFDTLEGVLQWERNSAQTTVRIPKLDFANADFAGSAAGTYRTAQAGPGHVDLSAQLARANVAQVHRYVPVGSNEDLRNWLRTALAQGTASDVRIKLAGNLADLPFAAGKGNHFLVTAKAKDVLLDYAPRWPAIGGIDVDFRLEGPRLTIGATRGRVYDTELRAVRAEIANLAADHPLLHVEGSAAGPVADFLRFVGESPVAGWTGHLTDGAAATGEGRMALRLALVLGRFGDSKVTGEFTCERAELRLPRAPVLAQLSGALVFSEAEVRARDLSAEVLGGPAKLAVVSAGERVRVSATGSAPLASVRRELNLPYLDRLSGTLDWSLTADVVPGLTTWALESPLTGVAVDLPAPLGKTAAEALPLRVERRGDAAHPDEDLLVATYGRAARLVAHRRLAADGAKVDRALVSLGRAAERPEAMRPDRAGFWLRAELPSLHVDDWLVLASRDKSANSSGANANLELEGVELAAGELDAFGIRLHDLNVTARRSPAGWRLDLRGAGLDGTATWVSPNPEIPTGRVVARLARFGLPGKGETAPRLAADAKARGPEPKSDAAANAWPELDIVADTLVSKGRSLGRMELRAQPRGTDWRIERLTLANDSGKIVADGEWRVLGPQEQTRMNVALDAKEAGEFLARFGYVEALQGAPTKIDGQLAWSGSPLGFDYPTLSGAFRIGVGSGRFIKIEPGFGKLLGVLSLQALPRRISLDFRDVFSEGFAFDEVTGAVRIANGVMSTDNLRLLGPAAQVDIAGDADLAHETQRLTVRVQPSLSGSVSTGAALLFFANPLVGAAIGAGSLLAQKVLKDPIEQMFSYQYAVTGSWSDPVVTRSGSATASAAPGTPGMPVERATP